MTSTAETRLATFLNRFPAALVVLIAIIAYQLGAVFSKDAMTPANASGLLLIRFVLGAAVILAITRIDVRRLTRPQWMDILLFAAVLALSNLAFYWALEMLPIALVATIGFLGPLCVGLMGAIRPLDFLWPLLGFAGVLLLTPWTGNNEFTLEGILYGLFFALLWAAYILCAARVAKVHGGLQIAGLSMALASLCLLPLGVSTAGEFLQSQAGYITIFLVTVFSSLPIVLDYFALKRIKPSTFGVLMSTEPAIGAIAGMIMLGELLSVSSWIALILVSAASLGATLTHSEHPVPEVH